MDFDIVDMDAGAIDRHLEGLSRLLSDTVNDGAAIGFMLPFSADAAVCFWTIDVRREVSAGRRVLLGALRNGEVIGAVQLITALPPNQPHRCEIAKMMVLPTVRRRGVGRTLMMAALAQARRLGKVIVTLDTRTGDVAQPLYAAVGFESAGEIPDYAWDPDGRARHSTTLMFCRL